MASVGGAGVCLCVILCVAVCGSAREIYDMYQGAYGNDLARLNHYLDAVVPTYTRFNYSNYNRDISACPYGRLSECHVSTSNRYARDAQLWVAQFNEHHHPLPDCVYTVKLANTALVEIPHADTRETTPVASSHEADDGPLRFYDYIFDAKQECTHTQLTVTTATSPVLGGSSFDFLAYTSQSLATCTTTDNLNNTYVFRCRIPLVHSHSSVTTVSEDNNALNAVPDCIHMTVMLEHEHYDTFSLVIESDTVNYPPDWHVLLDNVTFCSSRDKQSPSQPAATTQQNPLLRRRLVESSGVEETVTSNVHVYSGLWMKQSADGNNAAATPVDGSLCGLSFAQKVMQCQQQLEQGSTVATGTNSPSSQCAIAWYHNHSHNHHHELELLRPATESRYTSPAVWTNQRGCFNDAITYKTRSGRLWGVDSSAPLASKSTSVPLQFSFRPIRQHVVVNKAATLGTNSMSPTANADATVSRTNVPGYPSIRHLVPDSGVIYKFIGASHMRYSMMGLAEHIYGKDSVGKLARKGDYLTYFNLSYDVTQYADDLVEAVRGFCRPSAATTNMHAVLILQNGDWDLSVGITRVLRDSRYADNIISLLRELLDGSLACPHVRQIVFVTAMPYPQCFTDIRMGPSSAVCQTQRGFRTNSAMAALNTYYLEKLTRLTVHSSKKFSIVDAYSIIMPRILMNENYEITCGNHFSCAVNIDEGQQGQHTEMIYGQSGLAMMQAILHALAS
jgi:hypothetical protein